MERKLNSFLQNSAFFGIVMSIFAYGVGCLIRKKSGFAILNPLLISILMVIAVLKVGKIDYKAYYSGVELLNWLLTPATICLAIPLYENIQLLKNNWKALAAGIGSGVLTSALCVFFLSHLFQLKHAEYVTLLPKSITTAIGIGVSEELGGYVTITVAIIIVTGILGNIFAEPICRTAGIRNPVARGVAIGTSSHAIGTSKAMEMGKTEGAISSLSLVVAGLLTVISASVMAKFI